jgi:hypothetical protein
MSTTCPDEIVEVDQTAFLFNYRTGRLAIYTDGDSLPAHMQTAGSSDSYRNPPRDTHIVVIRHCFPQCPFIASTDADRHEPIGAVK